MEKKKLSLPKQIGIALLLGILAGYAFYMLGIPEFTTNYLKPFGTIFVNLLKFIVVPVVLLSMIDGIISMGDMKKVGSVGWKTVAYFLVTTAAACVIGLVFANLFNNAGWFPTLALEDGAVWDKATSANFMDTLVAIFPSNMWKSFTDANMLQVIVIALMFGGSTDNYIAASSQGLLEAYQSPELSNTPENYLDPDGVWNPIYVGAIAFACNKDWFADKGYDYPTSWDDLLDPKYQDMIIMAHPATSGTAYTVLATLIQLKGEDAVWDYLKELDKNMSQYTKSGSAAPNGVALGEAAIALTFSHDGLQPTTEGYPIELSFPTDGTGYEVGAMALIKGGPADEQENAKKFIDFMCSAEGQNLYAENNSFRVPTNSQATPAEGLVTLDSVAVIDYDAVWAAEHKDEFVAQFEANIASSENLE